MSEDFLKEKSLTIANSVTTFTDYETISLCLLQVLIMICPGIIHSAFEGIPGRLDSIKRLIKNGKDPHKLLQEKPIELIKYEWSQVDQKDKELLLCLALLAFDRGTYSIDELANIVGVPVEKLNEKIKKLSFVIFDDTNVRFISETHRNYVSEQLVYLKRDISEIMINYFNKQQDVSTLLA